MKRSLGNVVLSLAFLLGFPFSLFAFQTEVSEEQKINTSDLIVVGKVIGMESYWNAEQTLIYTTYRVTVTNMLKGPSATQEVAFQALGGMVGSIQLIVSEQPEFRQGDEAILYLRHNEQGTLEAAYGRQGASPVVEGVIKESGETLKSWANRVSQALRAQR